MAENLRTANLNPNLSWNPHEKSVVAIITDGK